MARDHKTAELSGSRIVGMTFKLGAEPKNLGAFQRTILEGIQSVKHTEADRYTAPKPTGPRHFPCHDTGKPEGLAVRGLEKSTSRLARHRASLDLTRPGNCDEIIKLQGNPQAIEAGAKIRRRGRNAHRDLLLFQRKSAENARKRDMAALILTWPQSAARCSEI
jgi:hypothetical protein